MSGGCEVRDAVLRGELIRPVRHMQLMSIVARCRYCMRPCCCVEHRLAHERAKHMSDAEQSCVRSHGNRKWAYLTETSLAAYVRDSHFPVHCVHCLLEFTSRAELLSLLATRIPCLPNVPNRCHLLARKPDILPEIKSQKSGTIYKIDSQNPEYLEPTPSLPNCDTKTNTGIIRPKKQLLSLYNMESSPCIPSLPMNTPLPVIKCGDNTLEVVTYNTRGLSSSTPCTDFDVSSSPHLREIFSSEGDQTSPLAIDITSPIEKINPNVPTAVVRGIPIVTPQREVIATGKKLITGITDTLPSPEIQAALKQRKVAFSIDTKSDGIPNKSALPVVSEEVNLYIRNTSIVPADEEEIDIINVTDYNGTDVSVESDRFRDLENMTISEEKSHLTNIVNALASAWRCTMSRIMSSDTCIFRRKVRPRDSSPTGLFLFGERSSSDKRARLCSPQAQTGNTRRRSGGPFKCVRPRPPLSRMKYKR